MSMGVSMLMSLSMVAVVRMEHLIRFPAPERDKEPNCQYLAYNRYIITSQVSSGQPHYPT